MAIAGIDDLVETPQSLVQADNVMKNLFVDFVRVLQFPEIDTLSSADNLDLGSV